MALFSSFIYRTKINVDLDVRKSGLSSSMLYISSVMNSLNYSTFLNLSYPLMTFIVVKGKSMYFLGQRKDIFTKVYDCPT